MVRLYQIFAILCIACTLGGGGLAGYLLFTGQLSADKLQGISALLRGESPAASAPEAAAPPASAPAEESLAGGHGAATEELQRQRRDAQLRRLTLERATRDMQAQRDLLNQAVQDLVLRGEKLEADQSSWQDQQKKLREESHEVGFAKELELVAGLSPGQAKDHLLHVWGKSRIDAVRLINALPKTKGKSILSKLRTPEETQMLSELMEQLRNLDADSSGGAGTPAAETPG